MKTRSALQFVLLTVLGALLVLPTANMVHTLFDQPSLIGAVVKVERPELRFDAIISEAWQKQFTRWFEQNYGIRPTATRIDNSINYYAFHETRAESSVRVGKNDVLFLHEQLWFYNRQDDPQQGIERFATDARSAHDLLAARGKYLVVMLLPSKTTIYPEDVPRGWILPLGTPRPSDTRVYRAFVDALKQHGVPFVDGRALVSRDFSLEGRALAYPLTGRHLAAPAACRILDQALGLARPHLADTTIPNLDCSYELGPARGDEEELDLVRLLNIWPITTRPTIAKMAVVPERVAKRDRPDTLIAGSSFGWRMFFEAERNHALGAMDFFYYNASIANEDFRPVPPPGSDEWRHLVLDKKLFLLAGPEEFVPGDNSEFLRQLVEALSH